MRGLPSYALFWGLRDEHANNKSAHMVLNDELDAALTRLIDDYGHRLAVGSILRCFARSVHDLRSAGVAAGLAIAAEAMTQRRLEARLSPAPSLV